MEKDDLNFLDRMSFYVNRTMVPELEQIIRGDYKNIEKIKVMPNFWASTKVKFSIYYKEGIIFECQTEEDTVNKLNDMDENPEKYKKDMLYKEFDDEDDLDDFLADNKITVYYIDSNVIYSHGQRPSLKL